MGCGAYVLTGYRSMNDKPRCIKRGASLGPYWGLDGGDPMSHVNFKKFPCPLLLFTQFLFQY